MINLLSPNDKKQLKAAYANSILMRYVVMAPIVLAIIVLEMVVVYFILATSQTISKNTIADNQQKAAQYSSVKQQAENFRSNLSIAKYILNTQAPYTDILTAIAQKMPGDTAISEISVNPSTFGTATQITAIVTSHEQAIVVKNNLQKAAIGNILVFDSVSLESTSQNMADGQYTAVYSVIFSKKVLP